MSRTQRGPNDRPTATQPEPPRIPETDPGLPAAPKVEEPPYNDEATPGTPEVNAPNEPVTEETPTDV